MGQARTLIRKQNRQGVKAPGTVLERYNETREDENQLHPTKGERRISIKRARAQQVMANILSGQAHPINNVRAMGKFIREGL